MVAIQGESGDFRGWRHGGIVFQPEGLDFFTFNGGSSVLHAATMLKKYSFLSYGGARASLSPLFNGVPQCGQR